VGCNHPQRQERLGNCPDIDKLCSGDDLSLPEGKHTSEARFGIPFESKVISCIRTLSNTTIPANALLEETDVEWIITLHSDSWFLNLAKIKALVELLKRRSKTLGICGFDTTMERLYLVDFLFIAETKMLRESRLFDFAPIEALTGSILNVHSTLMVQIIAKVGLRNVLCYSDYRDMVFWDGQPVFRNRFLAPYCEDPQLNLVHVNVGSFFDDHGEALQARLLRLHGIDNPAALQYREQYDLGGDHVLEQLAKCEKHYANKLRWRFCDFEELGFSKSFRYIERYLQQSGQLKTALRMLYRRFNRFIRRAAGEPDQNICVAELYDALPEEQFAPYVLWNRDFYLTQEEKRHLASIKSRQ